MYRVDIHMRLVKNGNFLILQKQMDLTVTLTGILMYLNNC